jgi:hypothetical protein
MEMKKNLLQQQQRIRETEDKSVSEGQPALLAKTENLPAQ